MTLEHERNVFIKWNWGLEHVAVDLSKYYGLRSNLRTFGIWRGMGGMSEFMTVISNVDLSYPANESVKTCDSLLASLLPTIQ